MRKGRDGFAALERVRRRFERWRRMHRPRARISGLLWAAAVRAAGTFGVHRTAKALRVDYYSLKKRVQQEPVAIRTVPQVGGFAPFIELTPAASASSCECDLELELESAGGAKMRVHLKSIQMPDLAALARSFWDLQS
jgi:hypothetical protein